MHHHLLLPKYASYLNIMYVNDLANALDRAVRLRKSDIGDLFSKYCSHEWRISKLYLQNLTRKVAAATLEWPNCETGIAHHVTPVICFNGSKTVLFLFLEKKRKKKNMYLAENGRNSFSFLVRTPCLYQSWYARLG